MGKFMREAITSSGLSRLRLKRRPDVRSRLVDGEMIVLDREKDLIHQFNQTATFIWERCDGHRSAAEIAHEICETFEVDEPTAVREVIETLQRLQNLELVGEEHRNPQPRKEK
jgi:hypothetical protein